MTTELIVALVSAVIAVLSAVMSIYGQMRVAKFTAEREEKKEAQVKRERAEEILSRYREPLINAAFELQSRIFNLLKLDFLDIHYVKGTTEEKEYAVNNTLFVIAQYFGWSEVIRRDIQFLDLGGTSDSQRLSHEQDDIANVFLKRELGPVLRVFRGNQRAIGELMIVTDGGAARCMGYASFVDKLRHDEGFAGWYAELRASLEQLATDPASGMERLTKLQHELVEIIDYLDPECVRFPKGRRSKV
jgi:hypothetical protein